MGAKNFAVQDWEADKFDPDSRAVTVISEQHRCVHEGWMYHASKKGNSLLDAGVKDFLISVPAGAFPHFQGGDFIFGRGDIDIEIYEGTTTSSDGSALTSHNINRNSSNVSQTELYEDPTVTDVGTLIHQRWAPPTVAGVGQSATGVVADPTGEEWVLQPSTKYLVRITNNSGSTIDWFFETSWYEIDWRTGRQ